MFMTNAEIKDRWRRMEHKPSSVQILAELNCCDKAEIVAVLLDAGVPLGELARQKKPSKKQIIESIRRIDEKIAKLQKQKEDLEASLNGVKK